MNLPASYFPSAWLWGTNVASVALIGLAAWRIRWRSLDPVALNAWMGACVVIMLFWRMNGGLTPGLAFHLLGSTAFALLAGPWMALMGMAIVVAALAGWGTLDWLSAGLNYLIFAAFPVATCTLMLRLARRYMPANYFVYIFFNAFMVGGATFFASSLLGVLMLFLAKAYALDYLLTEVLPFYFLLSWSEAFTTGILIAISVVYKPHWVATFDDRFYFYNKKNLGGS